MAYSFFGLLNLTAILVLWLLGLGVLHVAYADDSKTGT